MGPQVKEQGVVTFLNSYDQLLQTLHTSAGQIEETSRDVPAW
jgi:DNA repair protein RadC